MTEPAAARSQAGSGKGARGRGGDRTAVAMLVLLTLIWGVSWPVMKIALDGIPPFSMRTASTALGALTLLVPIVLQRRSFAVKGRYGWFHLAVAGFFTMVCYALCASFAQLNAETSRVAVLVYTMPIWVALMARVALKEQITPIRAVALALCAVGLAVLFVPHLTGGLPSGGTLLAIGAGAGWAAGTVYLKWARIQADLLALTMWQLVLGFLVITAVLPLVEGGLHLWPAPWMSLLALLYTGVVAVGIAYLIWFEIVRRLPAVTAALGVLSIPALGVVTSMLMLGERPTAVDFCGFVLIIGAAACAIVPPRSRTGG